MSQRRKLLGELKMNSDCGDTPAHRSDSKESSVFDEVKEDDCKEPEVFEHALKELGPLDGVIVRLPTVDNDIIHDFGAHEVNTAIGQPCVIIQSQTDDSALTQQPNELRTMINDFQEICNVQLDRIAEFTNALNIASGDQVRQESQVLKLRKKKNCKHKTQIFKNLITLCMIIVLLMQIHMYILLYGKFNRVHNELKQMACVVYGKSCPNSRTAYECMSNKLDFIDSEHTRSMDILQKDMEDVVKAVNNISQLIYSLNEEESGTDSTPPSQPLRTGSVYPVNP